MGHMLAVVVGPDQGANHEHGSAGGAHEAGQKCTNGKDGGVETWAAMQITANEDSARHGVQSSQEHNEWDVFCEQRVDQILTSQISAKHHGKGYEKCQGPRSNHLAVMVVPKMGR